jgi:hypothetical protein
MGREDDEEDVASYWILRKREYTGLRMRKYWIAFSGEPLVGIGYGPVIQQTPYR